MDLTDVKKGLIDAVLDEATLLGIELDKSERRISLAFSILWLPEDETRQAIDTITIALYGIHRLAASHRDENPANPDVAVLPIKLEKFADVVMSLGGTPVYGGSFLKDSKKEFSKYKDRLSIDHKFDSVESLYSIYLFQEDNIYSLDFWIWFDELKVFVSDQQEIGISDLYEGCRRWWVAFYNKDSRTSGKGMYPVD